jgi:hypothetical protein
MVLVPHHYRWFLLLQADSKQAWVHVLSHVQEEHVMWASPVLEVRMGQLELFHGAGKVKLNTGIELLYSRP